MTDISKPKICLLQYVQSEHTTLKVCDQEDFFNVLERSLICSPRLLLFDKKIVILCINFIRIVKTLDFQ